MKVKDSEKSRVLSTTDYKLFTYEKERIFRKKIDMIKMSMMEKNISKDVPILVDEQYKVLSGKHRLIANMELKQPIYYKVAEVANYIDLLKASTLDRKPRLYDFMLAHKEKLFYRKAIEHTKMLPYSCEEIFTKLYQVSINWASNDWKKIVNGKMEFDKKWDFIATEADLFICWLNENYNYFESDLSKVISYLEEQSYSCEQSISAIQNTPGINQWVDLHKKGHPDICESSLFDYCDEVQKFERSDYLLNDFEQSYINGFRRSYPRYPTLIIINRFYKLDYQKNYIHP